ncbi:hypothetical protein MKJ04_11470 [Pontibacter sp. E15-1]|uniref:hypothetical protein n=1 Tax=Pontibacter sp. E15-1 TaxID=2919918 RepID=UPI001F4FDB03|nr:hypothetical protein [Pontibacter sp. E15-1]MCJ8165463.1 hypothetical protein [Pontibacter sp. E15-1]
MRKTPATEGKRDLLNQLLFGSMSSARTKDKPQQAKPLDVYAALVEFMGTPDDEVIRKLCPHKLLADNE